MSETLQHLDQAIAEVTKARAVLRRSHRRQVTSGEERDRLKAVSLTWFQTHRVHVEGRLQPAEVKQIDEQFRLILDSTAKSAARNTYSDALFAAKSRLVDARGFCATMPVEKESSQATPLEPPPKFSTLTADASMQTILVRRWAEVQQCLGAGAHLAATVMMGGLMESLLVARINSSPNKAAVFTAKSAPRDPKSGATRQLADWTLAAMVEVGHEVGWLTRSAKDLGTVLREFRNYIHPHKEHADGVSLTLEDGRVFWDVTKSICRQLLASVGGVA